MESRKRLKKHQLTKSLNHIPKNREDTSEQLSNPIAYPDKLNTKNLSINSATEQYYLKIIGSLHKKVRDLLQEIRDKNNELEVLKDEQKKLMQGRATKVKKNNSYNHLSRNLKL